jgi:hypothetical protein
MPLVNLNSHLWAPLKTAISGSITDVFATFHIAVIPTAEAAEGSLDAIGIPAMVRASAQNKARPPLWGERAFRNGW